MANNANRSRIFLYVAVFIGNLVTFSGGIVIGWASPVIVKLTNQSRIEENPFGAIITSEESSWISSIVLLGGICGPIVAGFWTDRIGRKKTLILCSGIPLLVSYLLLAFGKHVYLYYFARFIAGSAFSTLLSVLSNFFSEISEDAIRGRMSASINIFIMSGVLYAYVVGPYFSIMWFNIACAVWPLLFLILFDFIVPESPYYLIACNDFAGALQSLKKFRSASEDVLGEELKMIKYSVDREARKANSFATAFKSKGLTKALIISLTLVGFQAFSGINSVLFNAQFILGATDGGIPPEISAIIVGSVQFCASFIAPLAADRFGRKLLLLYSALGMLTVEVPLGVYFYLYNNGKDVSSISWLPTLCLIGYIIFYNFGFGILPWTVMAEVFPANIKASASTLTVCFNALLHFFITKSFPYLVKTIGMGGTFWFFSIFCAISVPFLLFYMIETKGKSFEEIQNILAA